MRYTIAFASALVFAFAPPVSGHHSDAGLDMQSVTTFQGTVTEFNWRNPHVYITVASTDERGEPVEWALQMGSTIVVTRMGWTRDSLVPGDRVTVGTHAARNGRPYGLLNSLEKEGGVRLPTAFGRQTGEPLIAAPQTSARATSLEGLWLADVSKLVSYPGGLDGLFNAELRLTQKGRAAQAAYDELSDDNPGAHCIGMPTPVTIVTTNLYPLEIRFNTADDTIMIRSDYFDDERTVYMDGRGHPDSNERWLVGHSIGHWESEVLAVDTTNFSDHRSAYQTGVPSGAQKHVVERYRLNADGTRITVDFTLEDPEYIAEPMTHVRELIYSPNMQVSPFNCDPQATRRFLPQ